MKIWKAITSLNIRQILLIGLAFRLLAAFFAKGYVFHDDHFFVIELAENWKNGRVDWMSRGGEETAVLSLLYPGFHYLLFKACNALGLTNPDDIMLLVRLLHGLFSLLTIYAGYLLTKRLSNREDVARIVAFLFSVFWFFPFLSVHNVKEFVCIPFLLLGSYFITNAVGGVLTNNQPSFPKSNIGGDTNIYLSALFFALAICLRIQTVLIPFGIGIFLLLHWSSIRQALIFGVAFVLCSFLTQGLFDYLYYGNPLETTLAYFKYNSNPVNISNYPTGPWYQYIGTLAAMSLGPPFILFAWGYICSFNISRPTRMFFIASLLFFAYHSFYPGKQERFILPFLPFFLILGTIGFQYYYEKKRDRRWLIILSKSLIAWFLILNTVALIFLSFSYSKRSRVEAMNYLRKKGNVTNIIIESPGKPDFLPLFYLQKDIPYYAIGPDIDTLKLKAIFEGPAKPTPNYLIISGDNYLETRLNRLRTIFPNIVHEADIQQGLLDNLAYRLNPAHNVNEVWKIYRLK